MSSKSSIAQTIAIAGAVGGSEGNNGSKASVGSAILDKLLKTEAKIVVLVRQSSVNFRRVTELKTQGAQITVIDYSDPSSVEKALKGVDVVISAVSGGGFQSQSVLADAAKAAGVTIFVPSEFGMDTTKVATDSPLYSKREFQLYLDSIGLPYVKFFCILFAEFIPLLFEVKDGQVEIVGSDDPLIDSVSKIDVASFITHVLTTVPTTDLAGRTFRLTGFRVKLIQLVSYLEKKQPSTDPKLRVVRVSVEDALSRAKANNDIVSYLKARWALGDGLVGTNEQIEESRKAFNEWDPLPLENFV